MEAGEALDLLTCQQAMQVWRRVSGLSLEEIAQLSGRDSNTVGCWFSDAAERFPPLPLVPMLCHRMGSPLIIEWLWAQYWLLREGSAVADGDGDVARVRSLLLRSMGEITDAINLTQDIGAKISGRDARQISQRILLAVSTLAEAAREARGPMPEQSRRLRFSLADDPTDAKQDAPETAGRVGWLFRMRRRLAAWIDGGETIRERDAARAERDAVVVSRAENNAGFAKLVADHERRADEAMERLTTAEGNLVEALTLFEEIFVTLGDPLGRSYVTDSVCFKIKVFLGRHGR